MNFIKLCEDYRIGHTITKRGWVEVRCPHCFDRSRNLGFSTRDNFFHCWRCGWHATDLTVAALIGIDSGAARQLVLDYGGRATPRRGGAEEKIPVRIGALKKHKHPSDVGELKRQHRQYLADRGFDPDAIIRDWHVLGTGPVSELDGIKYKFRILIPIMWDGREVSFQTRDITNRQAIRYISCPQPRELIHYKSVLYGDESKWTDTVILVEGVFDVWRLGAANAICTFGTTVTEEQQWLLRRRFDRVIIAFDPEHRAKLQAERLAADLTFLSGMTVKLAKLPGKDPADLTDAEAANFVASVVER